MEVICIAGSAQAGKDSHATCMKKIFDANGYSSLIIHHGDYLKFIAKSYFGWSGEKDLIGRTLLQKLGTDIVRERDPDFWVKIIKLFLSVFEDDYDYVLIPDCRFPNEIDSYKGVYDTTSILILRPEYDNGLTEEQNNHPSETALKNYPFDITITTQSGMDNVMTSAEFLVKEVFGL